MKLPESITSYWSTTFLKYLGKWQIGILISWPCMWLTTDVLHWSNASTILFFQLVGAVIFWNVDRWIFTKKSTIPEPITPREDKR